MQNVSIGEGHQLHPILAPTVRYTVIIFASCCSFSLNDFEPETYACCVSIFEEDLGSTNSPRRKRRQTGIRSQLIMSFFAIYIYIHIDNHGYIYIHMRERQGESESESHNLHQATASHLVTEVHVSTCRYSEERFTYVASSLPEDLALDGEGQGWGLSQTQPD